MQALSSRPAARAAESPALTVRLVHAIASSLKRRPDQRLVNAKFTDTLEREIAERAYRDRY